MTAFCGRRGGADMKTHSTIPLLSPDLLVWLAGALIFIALVLIPQKAAADTSHAGKSATAFLEPDYVFMPLPGAVDGEEQWRPNVYHYTPSNSSLGNAKKSGFNYSDMFFSGRMELGLRSSYVASGTSAHGLDAHARFFIDQNLSLTAGQQQTELGNYLLLRWTLPINY